MSIPVGSLPEATKWSLVAYHCAYDETLLGVLIDSLVGHGMTKPEAETVLGMAWELADDRDEDSLRTGAIDAVASRLAAPRGGAVMLDLAALKTSLAARSRVRTHWEGCYLDPTHRDCALYLLLAEIERG